MAAHTKIDPRGQRFAATLTGVLLVLRGPDQIFGWALAALVGLAILWVLVSALSPASADRRCPRCGTDGLERLDPETTEGLRCRGCGWSDATESSFLLAEDDGVPLEPIVLREREARRKAPSAPQRQAGGSVDTLRTSD